MMKVGSVVVWADRPSAERHVVTSVYLDGSVSIDGELADFPASSFLVVAD